MTFLAVTAIVTAAASNARASDPEAIRLDLQAEPSCVDEASLRTAITDLHGAFRDASPSADARIFRVTVASDGGERRVRLVIDDAGHERSRESAAVDCQRATRTAALFVSLALDEHHEAAVQDASATPPPPVALADAPASPAAPSSAPQSGSRFTGSVTRPPAAMA